MKLRKNLILILIIIGMLLCSITALAMTTATKEENYKAAVLQLETYLESSGDNSAELAGILSAFNELGGYEQSKFLGYYVSVLMKIADEQYDFVLTTYLDMLEANTTFNNYLQDTLKGSSICTVDILKAYSLARECEHKGENNKAIDYYKQCMSFYDASERYYGKSYSDKQRKYDYAVDLLRSGDFVGTYFQFASIAPYNDSDLLMASIVNQLGYTPSSPDDTLKPVTNLRVKETRKDSITLSWTASSHAQTYEVYYQQSGSTEWASAGNTDGTQITISPLAPGVNYNFKVVATSGKFSANEAILQNQKIIALKAGDYVTFGTYPQTKAGTDKTPIEWLVLEVQDNKALLISRYILDCQRYNEKGEDVTWETCSLRAWLNGTFLNRAFTAKEQQGIVTTLVDNSEKQGFGEEYETKAGNATQDKLFLLSIAEVHRYFPDEEARRCAPTDYAIQRGCPADETHYADGRPSGWWWLRSRFGGPASFSGTWLSDGWMGIGNVDNRVGARPALWINLDAGIF